MCIYYILPFITLSNQKIFKILQYLALCEHHKQNDKAANYNVVFKIYLLHCYIVYLQAIIQIPEKVQSFSITQGNSSKSEEWILLVGSSTGEIYRTNDLEYRTQLKQAHVE